MFYYPAHWKQSSFSENRYEGEDGFFQLSLISSEETIDQVAKLDAFHITEPYGTDPSIRPISIDGHSARLILPGGERVIEMESQGALIIQYHKPVIKGNMTYNYLILWVDLEHLFEIVETVEVLSY
jgi:TolB protein